MADRDLVAAVLAGDREAFAALYRAHVHGVVAAVRDRVGDRESVADVVQEAFARALDNLRSLRDPDRFRPWLLAIARHAAVDHQRGEARERARSEPDPGDDSPSADLGPDDVAALREMASLVSGCVAGLSARDATVLGMVAHLGFGPTDIAGALGVTAGAAKVIVHRARRRLRAALALELAVRRQAGACPAFEQLEGVDPVGAAQHVVGCEACERAAADEVAGYGAAAGGRQRVPAG